MIECSILPSDMHLYLLDARRGITEAQRQTLFTFLDMEKKERLSKRKLGRDEALLADVLRQYALFDAFGLRPEAQRLAYGPHGKPYLADRKDFYFNYSHSEGLILCAAARREIGVDIQKIKPYNARLSERICTEAELVQLSAVENKADAFCRLWTKKEAAAKLYGTGLFREHPDEGFFYTDTFKDYILTFSWL